MTHRDVLADALTATNLVKVTPGYRQTLKPQEGFVKWEGTVPDASGFGHVDQWEIWIALSPNVTTAETWIGRHRLALVDALRRCLDLESITPATLVLGPAGGAPGVIIAGTWEATAEPLEGDPVLPYLSKEV